jgi:hypothetical protein
MYVYNPVQVSMSALNASWDANMLIPTGRTINSVDTMGTVGANLSGQFAAWLLGVAMGV